MTPESTNKITSHLKQQEGIVRLLNAGKLAHSIMFVGTAGIGKKKIAFNLAEAAICIGERPISELRGCGKCSNCNSFRAGSYPDFYFIDCKEKEQASVAAIRELLSSLQLKSFSGSARVVVFDDSERLSVQALNALLKTLEEPLPNTFFILIAANSAQLPATVLSRCQKWFFGSLTDAQMSKILVENFELEESEIDSLVAVAGGSLSEVGNFKENLSKFGQFNDAIESLFAGNLKAAVDLASNIHSDKENVDLFIRMLVTIVRFKMIETEDIRIKREAAKMLSELLLAHQYIKERNVNSFYILQVVFENAFLGLQGRSGAGLSSLLV